MIIDTGVGLHVSDVTHMLRHSYDCCVYMCLSPAKSLWLPTAYISYGAADKIIRRLTAYEVCGGLQRRLDALTIARRTLQRTRAGIRQQLHTLHCYLSVICYNSDLVEVFTSLLSSSINQDKPTVTVTYDMTFNLGDFYVSVLLFRETEFDPSPIVPLAFLLCECKLQSTHDEFFSHIRKLCPQLDNAVNVVI